MIQYKLSRNCYNVRGDIILGDNYMEQNIGILFVVIGSLSASIGILEKNYMF